MSSVAAGLKLTTIPIKIEANCPADFCNTKPKFCLAELQVLDGTYDRCTILCIDWQT